MRPTRFTVICGVLSALSVFAALAWAEPSTTVVDAMRGTVPIPDATRAPVLRNAVNDDVRRPRNYDSQPPTIPHRVDGYQVDKNFNKCLDCHARAKTEFSQAIPVSETHYIDRSGKVLDHVSTRRYFCMQCHVAQEPVRPLVGNSFENLGTMTRKVTEPPRAKQ
ncbi:MAG: nitrate reductase cytochrome c-type subunit [Phycisphaerae bacterium]|nr:nitrate reductase cytochrome c-type subunit [Gemmatimonadaceae bacterium]